MTMDASDNSILLLGESGVGKTHYGAQLLKRLMKGDGQLRMNGAATNLQPFEAAMESLNEGVVAGHTATSTYVDSVWPIADEQGRKAQLVWPDYGGEQIKTIIESRRLPYAWRSRILAAPSWLFLIRLQQTRVSDDIFSRPLAELRGTSTEKREVRVSDQARLIELLQMLIYVRNTAQDGLLEIPRLSILLTCWDELAASGSPAAVLRQHLPMFCDFVVSNWAKPTIVGLSALGRPLSARDPDIEYATRGPEQFGYLVLPSGARSPDLTLPIKLLLTDAAC
jgi:hypothetical protein